MPNSLHNSSTYKMHRVGCLGDMINLSYQGFRQGEQVQTLAYHEVSFPHSGMYGGGDFYWDFTRPKADHNGGTIISPTVPWNGSYASLPDYLAGVGETDPGGTGCFVRVEQFTVPVEAFGALASETALNPDFTLDIHAPLEAATHRSLRLMYGTEATGTYGSGITLLRDAEYYMSQELNLTQQCEIRGMTSNDAGGESCRIWVAVDSNGIIVNDSDTYSDGVVAERSDAHASRLHGFSLRSLGGTTGHGLWMRTRSFWSNMKCRNFPENGMQILATANSADHREGNANGFSLINCKSEDNDGHGLYVEGADANAGYILRMDATANGGYGIYDSSFLGNCYVGCHTANNGAGSYLSDNNNARNTFVGCYAEGNQPGGTLVSPAIALGGFLTAPGITGTTITGKDAWLEDVSVFDGVLIYRAGHSGYRDYLRLRNSATSFASSRHVYIQGETSVKSDGTTPWPAGRIRFQPTGNNEFSDAGAIIFSTYNGETVNTHSDVLNIWGADKSVTPSVDNVSKLGAASNRWTEVFAATGTINTSDERLKQDIEPLDERERKVAKRLKGMIRKFRFKDAVEKKGDEARIHVGIIAQEVEKVFKEEGLDPWKYAILCHDKWERRPTLKEGGKVVEEGRPAGDRYSVRYEQLLAFIISAL